MKTSTQHTGVMIVNLGTPDSHSQKDVKKYLTQFLTDKRVIDLPWLWRQILVRAFIIPRRVRESAKNYQSIWSKEGAPLLLHGLNVQNKLQEALGDEFLVALAMRYQNPSIHEVLNRFKQIGVRKLIVLPLFPQYASATTGSVHEEVLAEIKTWETIPQLHLISDYPDHPKMIAAFCARAQQYPLNSYDHILFSFHGLPERQIKKADINGCCLSLEKCCQTLTKNNSFCYVAQTHLTAKAIADELHLPKEQYTICYQSRLGNEEWLKPYASDVIEDLARNGFRRLLVFCPSFVCDCLETTQEIGIEYAHLFKNAGGEHLQLVEGLNDHPLWIEALAQLVSH